MLVPFFLQLFVRQVLEKCHAILHEVWCTSTQEVQRVAGTVVCFEKVFVICGSVPFCLCVPHTLFDMLHMNIDYMKNIMHVFFVHYSVVVLTPESLKLHHKVHPKLLSRYAQYLNNHSRNDIKLRCLR